MADLIDLELLSALGVEPESKQRAAHTPREERIIAGFEEIQRFVEEQGRAPQHGEDKDIFERLYAVRLDRIRQLDECRNLVKALDHQGLLDEASRVEEPEGKYSTDRELLDELGVPAPSEGDVTFLQHVRPRAEIRAAEEIADRTPCKDFDQFKPLFEAVENDLKTGVRKSIRFGRDASIETGNFFILSGQWVYVAETGESFKAPNGAIDARLRVIYSNGTESNLLRRSLQRALYKDEAGRRLSDPDMGPLFSAAREDDDIESGTIYVLRSLSDHPAIAERRKVLHKIGVTGGDVKKRIANARLDSTYLMADVEVVSTYELYNINRTRLEKLIHRFFEPAKLDIEIKDRFGNPIVPREWFLVPLSAIEEAVSRISDGTIGDYVYDVKSAQLRKT